MWATEQRCDECHDLIAPSLMASRAFFSRFLARALADLDIFRAVGG